MYHMEVSNIRDALPNLVSLVLTYGYEEESRLGPVVALPQPIGIKYRHPKQHVLINPIRDANPFFHLMEAMWMLAGRQDGAFLDYYIKDFSKNFGNNGIIMDSYGFRWKYMFHINQLQEIVNQLRKIPNTRQAVLQMWHPEDLRTTCAKPCNLSIAFRIFDNQLDMTIFNRSNDLIWGCCGANAVHFPILQEYIASKIGIDVGTYWQISTNLHLYQHHLDMFETRIKKENREQDIPLAHQLRSNGAYEPVFPLMDFSDIFDEELLATMTWLDDLHNDKEEIDIGELELKNRFLRDVIVPMARAHYFYKKKAWMFAIEEIQKVAAEDWKRAGYEWIMRRFPGASK